MRVSPSQTAKSETDARGERSNRYLPSRTCGEWLSKICSTRTRACWLSTSTSTFINASERIESSGFSFIEEGMSTPDCALPCDSGSSVGSTSVSSTSRRALDTARRALDTARHALDAARHALDGKTLRESFILIGPPQSAELKKLVSKRARPPVVPK